MYLKISFDLLRFGVGVLRAASAVVIRETAPRLRDNDCLVIGLEMTLSPGFDFTRLWSLPVRGRRLCAIGCRGCCFRWESGWWGAGCSRRGKWTMRHCLWLLNGVFLHWGDRCLSPPHVLLSPWKILCFKVTPPLNLNKKVQVPLEKQLKNKRRSYIYRVFYIGGPPQRSRLPWKIWGRSNYGEVL